MALLTGLRIWHCYELWCSSQTWHRSCVAVLWCRLVATAPIGPLTWELTYGVVAALKRPKKKIRGCGPKKTEKLEDCNSVTEDFNTQLQQLIVLLKTKKSQQEYKRPEQLSKISIKLAHMEHI